MRAGREERCDAMESLPSQGHSSPSGAKGKTKGLESVYNPLGAPVISE